MAKALLDEIERELRASRISIYSPGETNPESPNREFWRYYEHLVEGQTTADPRWSRAITLVIISDYLSEAGAGNPKGDLSVIADAVRNAKFPSTIPEKLTILRKNLAMATRVQSAAAKAA